MFTGTEDSWKERRNTGSGGFSEKVLGEMQDEGLCSGPVPGTMQVKAVRYESITVYVCGEWKSVVPFACLNSQILRESFLLILSL